MRITCSWRHWFTLGCVHTVVTAALEPADASARFRRWEDLQQRPAAVIPTNRSVEVAVDWDHTLGTTTTAATMLTTVMPFSGRTDYGGPFEGYFEAQSELGAEYQRLLPWFMNPKAVVPELTHPDCTATKPATNWDSRVFDQVVSDYMTAVCGPAAATGVCVTGRSVAMTLSTMPSWLFVDGFNASQLPLDPWNTTQPMNSGTTGYDEGNRLKDPTCGELAAVVGRQIGWYTAGGFHDDCGHWHPSGLKYKWELLSLMNEDEHALLPGLGVMYTKCFDAVKAVLSKINPNQTLIGPEVCFPVPWGGPMVGPMQWIRHFVNASNHVDNQPPPVVTYHLGLRGTSFNVSGQRVSGHGAFFTQWDHFFNTTVLAIREILGEFAEIQPPTELALNEFCPFVEDWCDCTGIEHLCGGVALPTGPSGCPDWSNRSLTGPGDPNLSHARGVGMNKVTLGWNAAGASFAYGFGQLATLGYKYVGIDQLLGGVWPDNEAPAGSMDWQTGLPNAKYWVTKLLAATVGSKDHKLIFNSTCSDTSGAYALPFEMARGRGLLLVNKRPSLVVFSIPGFAGGTASCVDGTGYPHTPGLAPPIVKQVGANGQLQLGAFGVAVLSESGGLFNPTLV